ncbi:MAG: 2-phosphosulfolactate phosphatase [Ktedonobacterales bacterium]|nr:2-phosphosulfolactate phosphatase [Ktedonobacterales bacterium]
MLLDVVFSPNEIALALATLPYAACAVIDVVRATTTLTVLGEGGATRILVTADIALARRLHSTRPLALLTGEVGGLAPTGFDFGNSPSALGQHIVRGREIILATTNGTRAMVMAQSHGAANIYAASLRNAGAVAETALGHTAFLLICAGLAGRVALDDLYAAGVITGMIVAAASSHGVALDLSEGAQMAREMAATAGEPLDVLRRSQGGRNTLAIEMADDLEWCAAVNASTVVPRMTGITDEGALIFI